MNKSILLCLGLLTGCATATVAPYGAPSPGTTTLSKVKGKFSPLDVRGKTPGMEEVVKGETFACGAHSFHTPPNLSIANYVKDALAEELKAAGKYSFTGDKITIDVGDVVLDAGGAQPGSWLLDFYYTLNTRTKRVQTRTEFSASDGEEAACRRAAEAFPKAVEENFAAYYRQMNP